MENKNEAIILKIIKFTPPVFIIILSLTISLSIYLDYQKEFVQAKENLEQSYIQQNKQVTLEQVQRVYEYIEQTQTRTEQNLKSELKTRVYEAYNIAMNIYNENKDKPKAEVKKMIKDALREIRFFNGRGYFFIYSFDYEAILLPIAKQLEGKNFYNFKDGKGEYLTRKIIKMVKEKQEGFMNWSYHKPSDLKAQYDKIGFNKHFEPFDWFIGTGEYLDDFERDVKKELLSYLSTLRYENNNYIFVIKYDGTYLTHPQQEKIGTLMQDTKSLINKMGRVNSKEVYINFLNLAKLDGGFVSYIQSKRPNTTINKAYKVSYVKGLDDWQWMIGQGFYLDDVNKLISKRKVLLDQKFEAQIQKVFIATLILTVVLLLISLYISKLLASHFASYKEEIQTYHQESLKQQKILAQQTKMAALGEMIGNIAHQWRQPLSLITTAATGLKVRNELEVIEQKDIDQTLDTINETAQYLSRTIDDFRNFFSTNKNKSTFNVQTSFEKSLILCSAQFKNQDIQIIQNIESIELYNLENELIQVLLNILNNSKDELIKINNRRLIFISAYKEDNNVIIKIRDNAQGIDEKIIDQVFEPYFTTKHQAQGTGIGLYMAQEIVVKHLNGDIQITNSSYEFENEQYEGAEVTITLYP